MHFSCFYKQMCNNSAYIHYYIYTFKHKFNYSDNLANKVMNNELREKFRNRHIPYSVKKKPIFSDI